MTDELRARFLGRFLTSASERIAHALWVVGRCELAGAEELVAEMHACAGEAAMMGFAEISALAQAAEAAARIWKRTEEDDSLRAVERHLTALHLKLEELSKT